MYFGSTLQAILRLARVALAAILLVGVPLAEAATCGGEVASSSIEAAAENPASPADHGQQPGEAQHCIHGHCHHATPFKTVDVANAVQLNVATNAISREPGFILARVVTGLERPPKA